MGGTQLPFTVISARNAMTAGAAVYTRSVVVAVSQAPAYLHCIHGTYTYRAVRGCSSMLCPRCCAVRKPSQHNLGITRSVTVQVAYPALPAAQSPICIRDVRVDVTGTEHVDPKWVSSSYHGSEAVVHTSARVRNTMPTHHVSSMRSPSSKIYLAHQGCDSFQANTHSPVDIFPSSSQHVGQSC